jgi:hypothetical protein
MGESDTRQMIEHQDREVVWAITTFERDHDAEVSDRDVGELVAHLKARFPGLSYAQFMRCALMVADASEQVH